MRIYVWCQLLCEHTFYTVNIGVVCVSFLFFSSNVVLIAIWTFHFIIRSNISTQNVWIFFGSNVPGVHQIFVYCNGSLIAHQSYNWICLYIKRNEKLFEYTYFDDCPMCSILFSNDFPMILLCSTTSCTGKTLVSSFQQRVFFL